MKKIHVLFVMLLLSLQTVLAQSFEVSGRVTYSDDGSAVIGATIHVKGTQKAVLSDVDGNYKLSIPTPPAVARTLVFSYTGMVTQEIKVGKSGVYNIQLKSAVLQGEEIIVTGYGNIGRSSYAGAATVVSTDRLKDIPSVSIADRLQGNVAGVTMTTTSGALGSVPDVRIRGLGSINAGNNPLYVIDGVPIATGDAASGESYSEGGSSLLSTLNPNDIESMTVIKDAAAASLYGSRAANGVIIITTKKGKAGKTVFNVKANAGFSDMAIDWRPTHNGASRREILNLGLYNLAFYEGQDLNGSNTAGNKDLSNAFAKSKINEFASEPWNGYTDWRDLILRTGFSQNYEVSASGGNDKTKFYTSLSYNNTDGLVQQQNFDRVTGRINVDHKAGIFTLNASSLISNVNQQFSSEGTGYANPFMFIAALGSPSDYPYNKDGTINITEGFRGIAGSDTNPLWVREVDYEKGNIFRSFSSVSGILDVFEGFAVKQVFSYDYVNTTKDIWWDPRSGNGDASNGVYQVMNFANTRVTSQTMATYNKTFAEKHTISALASFETELNKENFTYTRGGDYPTIQLQSIENAANQSGYTSYNGNSLLSGVGKIDYTYDNKLYVGGSFRTDGSSKLAPQNRYGNFWSVSSYYRFTNDEWYQNSNVSNILTDAKIRASYGENGTLPSGDYDWRGVYQYGERYNGFSGAIEARIPNPNLSWERNLSTNIGVDLNFINKIAISVEYYNRNTKDLILEQPISQTTGFGNTLRNVGSMRNRGVELDIRAQAIQTKDFSWTIGLNLGHNKNTLTSLSDGQTEIKAVGFRIHRVGESFYSFFGYEYAGVDPKTGKELFYKNTEGEERETTTNIDEAKEVIIGSAEPTIQGGLNSHFTYKWFDLGFTLTYSIGGQVYDRASQHIATNGGINTYNGQLPTFYDIDKMWKQPGDIASQPMFQYGSSFTASSTPFALMSTNHLRLKNLTIGFSAPKKWTNAIKLQKLRIYAAGSNLFTIKDKNLHVDPEIPATGIVMYQTPPMRTVTFGVEIGF